MKGMTRYQQLGMLLLGVALCVIVGCGGSKVTSENFMKIKNGMTKSEVEGILGSPTKTEDIDAPTGGKVKESTWTSGSNSVQIRYDKNDKVEAQKGKFGG